MSTKLTSFFFFRFFKSNYLLPLSTLTTLNCVCLPAVVIILSVYLLSSLYIFLLMLSCLPAIGILLSVYFFFPVLISISPWLPVCLHCYSPVCLSASPSFYTSPLVVMSVYYCYSPVCLSASQFLHPLLLCLCIIVILLSLLTCLSWCLLPSLLSCVSAIHCYASLLCKCK